jgi:hypothetical protein
LLTSEIWLLDDLALELRRELRMLEERWQALATPTGDCNRNPGQTRRSTPVESTIDSTVGCFPLSFMLKQRFLLYQA